MNFIIHHCVKCGKTYSIGRKDYNCVLFFIDIIETFVTFNNNKNKKERRKDINNFRTFYIELKKEINNRNKNEWFDE